VLNQYLTKPKEKHVGEMTYYIPTVWKSGGTHPPCPPPNCAHGQIYMWRNHVSTLLPHFTSSRRPSTLDCSHRRIGTNLLEPQCCVALSQPEKESNRRSSAW